MGYVIDASITGIDGIMNTINMICTTDSKIILTSITISELEMMQKFHYKDGNDATREFTLSMLQRNTVTSFTFMTLEMSSRAFA